MFQSGQFSLREYLDMLYRRRWLILGVAIVGMMAGLIPASLEDPVYQATSTIRLRSDTDASPFDDAEENVSNQTRTLVTDQQVILADETRAAVIERLGPDALPFSSVAPRLVSFSELIAIDVTAPTAPGAADAANAYADVYVDVVREASVEALELQAAELRGRARDAADRQLDIDQQLLAEGLPDGERAALQQERSTLAFQVSDFSTRADRLEVEVALRQQLYSVVSRARPNFSPTSPSPFRPALIGFVLGFLVGLCIAVLLELLQDRISNPSVLESVDPELRILAAVPHANVDLDKPEVPIPRPMHEALRYLRTGLRVSALDHPFSSLLVSSSLPAEGKTTTAVNLARSMADDGQRVVLVDADTRKPSIHERLGLSNDEGLSSVLAGEASFADVVRYVAPTLAVVTAGPPTEAASELLRSYNFEQLIRKLREQADLVIVDTPPVLPVADALEVSRAVDASLLVVRVDRVRRRDVQAAVRRFRDARVRILGLVANDFSASATGYSRYGYGGYGYTYGDGPAPASADKDGSPSALDAERSMESSDATA